MINLISSYLKDLPKDVENIIIDYYIQLNYSKVLDEIKNLKCFCINCGGIIRRYNHDDFDIIEESEEELGEKSNIIKGIKINKFLEIENEEDRICERPSCMFKGYKMGPWRSMDLDIMPHVEDYISYTSYTDGRFIA